MHYQERERSERKALASIVRAAEALLEPTPRGKAAALVHLGLALVHIAASDPERRAHDLAIATVEAMLEQHRAERAPP